MGGGASKDADLKDYSDMVEEFESVSDKDEREQFEHMRQVFAKRGPVQTSVQAHAADHKEKHHLKQMAGLVIKMGRRHFHRGLTQKDFSNHVKGQDFNQPHPELAHDDLITNALTETVFSRTEKKAIKAAIRAATEITLDPGTEIIKQGEDGDTYYVVESGSLEVDKDGQKSTLGPGQHFGELALVYHDKSDCTVKVSDSGPAKLWVLTREVFRKVQHQTHGGIVFERAQWLRKLEIFKILTDAQIMRICYALDSKVCKKKETIVEQGESGTTMYLVVSGVVEEYVGGRRHSDAANETETHVVSTLETGEFFGEHALINRPHHYNATYKAGPEGAELLLMTTEVMDEVIGPLHQVLEEADLLNSLLSADTALSTIYDHHVNARHALHPLIEQLVGKEYQKGDILIKKGEVSAGVYILKTGQVTGYGGTFGDGDTFGEECLVEDPPAVEEDVVCNGWIDKTEGATDDVQPDKIFLLPRDIAMKFLTDHAKRGANEAHLCEERSQISYESLESLGLLGEGSFGTVTMVKAQLPDGSVECLALKRMGKNHLIEEDMLESTQQEKDILKNITPHPFVLRLYATYQDRDSVFMLTNMLQGGELYDYLHAGGVDKNLSTNDAQFYTANIFLGLSHLHEHGFVYRDMKPENVLIGADGYLCLIDLGFAKACPYKLQLEGESEPVYHDQCFTTCGTPEYMAPEFIFQTGHDKGADYWAMGCLVFEMFHGYTPFVDRNAPDDLSQIFVNIALHNNRNYDLPFKNGFSDKPEALFINAVLQPKSVFRLGVVGKGRTTFMESDWFKGFDWDGLYDKRLEPPYKPTIKDQFDKSNFGNKQSSLQPDPFDASLYECDPFDTW